MSRKMQGLRSLVAHAENKGDALVGIRVETLVELVAICDATANYFGYPKKAKPGQHREGRDKFNTLLDCLDKFDFGTYAPDELREGDLNV